MTQPTSGLGLVRPRAFSASSRARAMYFWSVAALTGGRVVLTDMNHPPRIRTVTVGPGISPDRAWFQASRTCAWAVARAITAGRESHPAPKDFRLWTEPAWARRGNYT